MSTTTTTTVLPPPETKSIATFSDGISALEYLPYNDDDGDSSSTPTTPKRKNHIAATSWDGTIQIYDTETGKALVTQTMESGPLLSLAVVSSTCLVTGGLDGSGTFVSRYCFLLFVLVFIHIPTTTA